MDIDSILDLLSADKSHELQYKGIQLAERVNCINVFIQPRGKKNNKNVWNNCALILNNRTDVELEPYIMDLLEWIADMNWPGANIIYNRLTKYGDYSWLEFCIKNSLKIANALSDEQWVDNLEALLIHCSRSTFPNTI